MNQEHQISFMNQDFKILSIEQEYMIHPSTFGLLPLTKDTVQCNFTANFHIEDYYLFLDKLIINNEAPSINLKTDSSEKQYEFDHCMVTYSGTILIGANLVKEYTSKGNKPAYFSYQNVMELAFEDGVLTTAVEQNKAMQRIRKNLELGLRSLTKSRDVNCIRRFMNSSFIGDYKAFRLPVRRMKYLKDMIKDYKNLNIAIKS